MLGRSSMFMKMSMSSSHGSISCMTYDPSSVPYANMYVMLNLDKMASTCASSSVQRSCSCREISRGINSCDSHGIAWLACHRRLVSPVKISCKGSLGVVCGVGRLVAVVAKNVDFGVRRRSRPVINSNHATANNVAQIFLRCLTLMIRPTYNNRAIQ